MRWAAALEARYSYMAPAFIASFNYGWTQAFLPQPRYRQRLTMPRALLKAENRIGRLQEGLEADLLLIEGNPLEQISSSGAHCRRPI